MKVLVTGAGGFLGRHVVPAICRRGHCVRALGRRTISVQELGWTHLPVESVKVDLCNGAGLDEALNDIDSVVHLAAEMHAADDRQVAAAEAATNNLVNSMQRKGVRRLILASSFSVYDWLRAGENCDEQSSLENRPDHRDGYTRAKLLQESMLRRVAATEGWSLTILRPGIIWGDGAWDAPQLGLRVGPIYFVIGPTRMLPLTHVMNCADAFALALEQSSATQETFNIVDGTQCSAWSYVRAMTGYGKIRAVPAPVPYFAGMLICRTMQIIGVHFGPKILRPACYTARFGGRRFSNQRIRQRLNWSPILDFETVLRGIDGKSNAHPAEMALAQS